MSQHTLKHTMCSLPMFVLGSPAYTAAGGDVALRLEYRPLRVKNETRAIGLLASAKPCCDACGR